MRRIFMPNLVCQPGPQQLDVRPRFFWRLPDRARGIRSAPFSLLFVSRYDSRLAATARSVRARHPSNFMRDVPTSPKISVFRMRPWHKSSNDSRECCLLRRDPDFYRTEDQTRKTRTKHYENNIPLTSHHP